MSTLAGRSVLVTGAAGGIGAAIARRFERDGARVTRTDLPQSGIARSGDPTRIACDLTDRAAVEALLERACADAPLYALVHCAARCGASGEFHTVAAETWHAYIGANLDATFHVGQASARRMIEARTPGRLVLIGSVNALAAEPGASPYVASKGGVRMLAKAMAVDLARFRITVNLVHPGPVTVPRNAALFAEPALEALFARELPHGRPGSPEDVAAAARYFADPENGFVTGAELTVDGGLTAQILAPSRAAPTPSANGTGDR